MPETKKCAKCGEAKELSKYGRNKAARDGLQNACKECINLQNKFYLRNKAFYSYKKDLRDTHNPGTKFCAKCKQELPLTAFGTSLYLNKGRQSYCRKCNYQVTKTNLTKFCTKIGEAVYRHKNNMLALTNKYGTTEADFQELMNRQKGCCAICEADFGDLDRRASVDYDTTTGEVRSLLCMHCSAKERRSYILSKL